MYIVCYKDAEGFILPCKDVTFGNILAWETLDQAEESMDEHKANIDWLLSPESTTKRKWYGKKYVVQSPRNIPNRPRRVRERQTVFIKKGRLVL